MGTGNIGGSHIDYCKLMTSTASNLAAPLSVHTWKSVALTYSVSSAYFLKLEIGTNRGHKLV